MSNDGVAAVEKALALLDCFTEDRHAFSLAALAKASGQPVTTTLRLLNSLERMNYVIRSEAGTYELGHRLLYLGKLFERSFRLEAVVVPVLKGLAKTTGASASYSIAEEASWRCLYRVEPAEGLRLSRASGPRDFDQTATSDVIRHWGSSEPVFEQPPRLPIFKSGSRDAHTAAFVTPVFSAGNKFAGALTLSGAASTLEAANVTGEFVEPQLAAAANLSRALGASHAFCQSIYTPR
ncbi:IclR family transcriptional regulator (plasmid) [Caballeronia sp. NK8]|uniref:IclR family transcriptional regulator n=1 Tax=Caballeronia sp. NK8 TaxID=140098 RepID=UPI001BB6D7D8|nr:helix-turn-helix domain-containing protein [Caballeronia sp. NK8]BCQ29181.1 IclR family transcriptional regulator [Caballeronia sp. NK8]